MTYDSVFAYYKRTRSFNLGAQMEKPERNVMTSTHIPFASSTLKADGSMLWR